MARETATPPAAQEANLLAEAAALLAKVDVARQELRTALLAGEQTPRIRAVLADLEQRGADVHLELAAIANALIEKPASKLRRRPCRSRTPSISARQPSSPRCSRSRRR